MNSFASKLSFLFIALILYVWSAKQTQSLLMFVHKNELNYYIVITDIIHKFSEPLNISLTKYHIKIDKSVKHLNTDCLLFGQIESPVKCQAIVSLCDNKTDSLSGILTIDGKEYVIKKTRANQHYSKESERRGRVKRELSAYQLQLIKQNDEICANSFIDTTPKWYRNYDYSYQLHDNKSANFGEAFVELAVYVDQNMLIYHNNDIDVIKQIVTISVAYTQTVLQQSNIEKHIKLNLVIKHFEIITVNNIHDYSITEHLIRFCDDQYVYRSGTDIDILFSGSNFWFIDDGIVTSKVLGFANLQSACKPQSNCIVLEGRGLKSGRILAHEIGHTFGVFHDGDRSKNNGDCDDDQYIMSATFGGSKTQWSECSVRQMRQYFLSLSRDASDSIMCFQQNPRPYYGMDSNSLEALRAGLTISAHKQCKISFGKQFWAYNNAYTKDICILMYCWSKLLVVSGHPALEGTMCAHNRYCRRGQCVRGRH